MASSSSELRQLDQVEYRTGVHVLLLTSALVGCFFIAFMANFPLENRIQRIVKAELAKIPGCRANFETLSFELLLPKVVLSDVQLPASCFGKTGNPITMRHLTLNFSGPSFTPMGVAFRAEGELNGQPLSIRYATGLSSQVIRIEEEAINLAKISTAFPGLPRMEGRASLNMLMKMSGQQMQEFKFLAESKDFVVPAQALGDFKLPRIALGNFALRASSNGPRKVVVEEFILGTSDAPIRAKFKGNIDLVPGNASFSPVNITGEAAFSPQFIESFSILNLMLGQFTQKDGFYQIRLGGTLGQIQPLPL